MTDPKAAEREAAIRGFLHIVIECRGGRPAPFTAARERHSEDCDLYAAALRALVASRERDAAVAGQIYAFNAAAVGVEMASLDWVDGKDPRVRIGGVFRSRARRLALEQGTPATPSICDKCNLNVDCRGGGCERGHCPACCPTDVKSSEPTTGGTEQ